MKLTKQQLKEELNNGFTLELSDELNIFEISFSKIRGKFILWKNGSLIKSTESFTNMLMRLNLNELELTDKF